MERDYSSKKLLISYLSSVYQCNNKYLNSTLISQSKVPDDVLLAMRKACELSELFNVHEFNDQDDFEEKSENLKSKRDVEETQSIISKMALSSSVRTPAEETRDMTSMMESSSKSAFCLPSPEEIHNALVAAIPASNSQKPSPLLFKQIHAKILGCFRTDWETIRKFKRFSEAFKEWHKKDSMYSVFAKEFAIMKKIKELSPPSISKDDNTEDDNSLEGIGFHTLKFDKRISKRKNKNRLSTLMQTFYEEEYETVIECLFHKQNSDQCIQPWQDLFIPVSAVFCTDHMESCLNISLMDSHSANPSSSKTDALSFIDCATLMNECNAFMEQMFQETKEKKI
ncbi:hypothetical protein C9374_005638 [Naegleria lovaniensis]|uniref:Uncharacterized protein n=1 Tax=Naegleria lovaniensis TaxID=51637 RepID=A0AA88GNI1_NAELO|nr:uncharacterized protein C9374_005638 [Naegleria lovaniensis]KAG2382436.1 hypothetical protein C9374_005638 [Naegleria lovaniensis]